MDPNQYPSKPETRRLLTAARYFLGERNFLDAADYASRALQSDPNHPEPNRILAIASVLSSRDHYAALGVTRFESDQNVIWSSCQTLTGVLNPTVNAFPYASEAYTMVLKAREVLSDPVEKAKFDNSLRGGTLGNSNGTFWTMCPYCYYVYEYDRAYEECCLRCDNDGCKRAFHGVKIVPNPPPSSVIEKGFYVCYGFFPLSFCSDKNGDKSDEDNGGRERSWDPFGTVSGCSSKGVITDVPDEDNGAGGNGFQDHQCNGHMTRDEAEGCNDKVGVFSNQTDDNLTKKIKEVEVTRKQMASWDSKKANGIGFSVNHNEGGNNFTDGFGEREQLLVEDEDFGQTFQREVNNDVESGVEFFYGDDDILIGLQSDSELEKME